MPGSARSWCTKHQPALRLSRRITGTDGLGNVDSNITAGKPSFVEARSSYNSWRSAHLVVEGWPLDAKSSAVFSCCRGIRAECLENGVALHIIESLHAAAGNAPSSVCCRTEGPVFCRISFTPIIPVAPAPPRYRSRFVTREHFRPENQAALKRRR